MKIKQLKELIGDQSVSAELRESAKEQLRALGEVIPEPVQEQPEKPEPETPKTHIGIFDELIERSAIEAREEVARLDSTQKTCGGCYLTASVEIESCELCGKVPDKWLLPSSLDSEQSMFSKMAAGHSVAQLKTALSSPWASAPGREAYARKLLPLKEAAERERQRQAEAEACTITSKASVEDTPVLVSAQQVASAIRFYDGQLAQLEKQIKEKQ